TFRPEPTLSSTSWPRSGPMMCDHITHPETWRGDEGDVVAALAPFAARKSTAELLSLAAEAGLTGGTVTYRFGAFPERQHHSSVFLLTYE
ncbi:hypothetical protein, partial [Gordonia sp. UBA7599]|uniref:hypothetical protein n=2 Tax=unclassified Gordonia (in: high G+C Gram-positive bacteria) TaxID=2657482 RepID=UPI0025C59FD3